MGRAMVSEKQIGQGPGAILIVLAVLISGVFSFMRATNQGGDAFYIAGAVVGQVLLVPGLVVSLFQIGRRFRSDKSRRTIFFWTSVVIILGSVSNGSVGIFLGNHFEARHDEGKAAYWFRKAADQGNAVGETMIGVFYTKGRGVPQDYRTAAYWYRKAAEQGNALGETEYGALYMKGRGVPQNYRTAAYWFRKAADQGLAEAETLLGALYEHGYGVPQDWGVAYALYSVAASDYPVAGKNRSQLVRKMTKSQVQGGQSLAGKMQRVGVLKALNKHQSARSR